MTGRLHECSICGRSGKWMAAWSWYGSLIDLEGRHAKPRKGSDTQQILKFCSQECRAVAVAAKRVPANAPWLDKGE